MRGLLKLSQTKSHSGPHSCSIEYNISLYLSLSRYFPHSPVASLLATSPPGPRLTVYSRARPHPTRLQHFIIDKKSEEEFFNIKKRTELFFWLCNMKLLAHTQVFINIKIHDVASILLSRRANNTQQANKAFRDKPETGNLIYSFTFQQHVDADKVRQRRTNSISGHKSTCAQDEVGNLFARKK